MRRLILASTSPYRKRLMQRLHLPFEALPPECQEIPLPGLSPTELVELFARQKAESLLATHPDAIVIGSDQGVALEGELLGKPGTVARARAQLSRLSGGTHTLITAVSVLDTVSGERAQGTDLVRLTFRRLSAAEIDRYISLDDPLDCAGCFKIESLGIALFERIDAEDPTAIEGLGLIRLVGLLQRFGISPLGPWTSPVEDRIP